MPTDLHEPESHRIVAASQPHAPDRVRCGAELVAISEHFYSRVFVGALWFVGVSTLTSVVFLPLRASAKEGRPPVSAVVAGLAVIVLAGFAIWRSEQVYRWFRRRPELELVPVLIAATLLSVVSPLRNELWWSACAILMAVALLTSLRRMLGYCLIVLVANLTTHVLAGDLPQTSPVGIVGLWIGLPFWTAIAAVIPDRMVTYILRLNTAACPRQPARRVHVWTAKEDTTGSANGQRPTELTDPDGPHTPRQDAEPPVGSAASTSRLTNRQLQVVALLADGHRYDYIGRCLSISPSQVHRHVTNAQARLKVQSVNQLVAVAVAEGLVPGPNRE